MPIVAVAGGTGKLGRAIVDAIKAARKFDVLILGRQANDEKSKEIGARIIPVDYTSPEAITSVLEHHNIETLISTLGSFAPAQHELNLIKGADKSSVTRRYIPNVWGAKHTEEIAAYYPAAAEKLGYLKALKPTALEWTAVHNGFFLDFYVAPAVQSYMGYMAIVVDLKNDFAAIPGSGDVPVVFTHSSDIGRFAAALLTKDKWEDESFIIGDKVTWNEFVRIGEEVKRTKFTVVYDSIDKLKTGHVTELPSHPSLYPLFPIPKEKLQAMFADFGIMFENGALDITDHTLNEDFPEIKPKTVRELISDATEVSVDDPQPGVRNIRHAFGVKDLIRDPTDTQFGRLLMSPCVGESSNVGMLSLDLRVSLDGNDGVIADPVIEQPVDDDESLPNEAEVPEKGDE